VSVPYYAPVVDPNRFVTPPWRGFFDRLDAALSGAGGGSGSTGIVEVNHGPDREIDPLAEVMMFAPTLPPGPPATAPVVAFPLPEVAEPVDIGAELASLLGPRPVLQTYTPNSVLFAGATRLPTEDARLTWDATNGVLGVLSHSLLNEAVTGNYPAAAASELAVKNSLSGGNTLALRNTHAGGFSAITMRTDDGHEVLAIGHGNASVGTAIFADANYIQSWSGVDTAANPKRFFISMDGNYGSTGSGVRFYIRQSFETNGDVKFWQLIPSTSTQQELLWLDAVNNRVLVGYNNGNGPAAILHVVGGQPIFDIFGSLSSGLITRSAGGTVASPSQTAGPTTVFQIAGRGYNDAGAYTGNLIAINGVAVVAPTTTNTESRLDIRVVPASSATLTTAMQVFGTSLLVNTGLLQFSTQTSAAVALKRSSAVLQCRLADDSAFAQFSALEFMSNRANFLMRTAVAWTNGAGAGAGTIGNAPAAGNPTKWIPVDDNGTTRYIPAW
jgi:hypothetical protein